MGISGFLGRDGRKVYLRRNAEKNGLEIYFEQASDTRIDLNEKTRLANIPAASLFQTRGEETSRGFLLINEPHSAVGRANRQRAAF